MQQQKIDNTSFYFKMKTTERGSYKYRSSSEVEENVPINNSFQISDEFEEDITSFISKESEIKDFILVYLETKK